MAEEDIKYSKFESVKVRSQGKNEYWIEEIIAKDPSILGLGDLQLIERQRTQPTGGCLDLLLKNDDDTRYEVELQLGTVDPSHIIRTIEYWDIERKRYPQYNHVAVIVAEDITSRFLNVIGLFNGMIPLIAIQMNAFKLGDQMGLNFVRVLDQMPLGRMEEDAKVVDRAYWKKQSPKTVEMADELLKIAKQHNPLLRALELNYTQSYIGPKVGGKGSAFFGVVRKKNTIRLDLRLFEQEEANEILDKIGREWKWRGNDQYYIIYSLRPEDIKKHPKELSLLITKAYKQFTGEDN